MWQPEKRWDGGWLDWASHSRERGETPVVRRRRLWNPIRRAWTALLLPICALGTALLLGAGLIWASGANVFAAYGGLFAGMCGSWPALVETCVAAIPYMLAGLAVALGFHGGLFNIGAEGQFYMGALGAAMVGYAVEGAPLWLHLPLALAAAALGGALWGALPGLLKAKLGAHEVINTIMMNYIAVKLVDYLVKGVLRDPSASLDRTPYVLTTAHLPLLLGPHYRLHAGLFLALAAVACVSWLLNKTTIGFEIRTVGANPHAARYAGIRVAGCIVLTMTLSGALAGLAGAGEVLGLNQTLPAAFSSGYGFDAIAVALLAKSHPIGIVPAALLWGGLRNGAGLMQVRSGISIDLIYVVQALVIVCIAADQVVHWLYRLQPRGPADASP
jgi:general nucleoside transport system permease protein